MCIYKNVQECMSLTTSGICSAQTGHTVAKHKEGRWTVDTEGTNTQQNAGSVDKVRFGINFQSIAKMPKCQEVSV